MSSKKQTAVEWLMEHITYDNDYGQRWVSFKEATDLKIYFQKALSMMNEQIMDAYFSGIKSTAEGWNGEYAQGNSPNIKDKFQEEFKQYYNETYGN